jgi:hypothetical protein
MASVLKQRKGPFHRTIGDLKGEMVGRGGISSRGAFRIRAAYEREYDECCRDAWVRLLNIATTIGVEPDTGLADDLKDVFGEVSAPYANKLLSELRSDKSIMDDMRDAVMNDATAAFGASRDLIGTEIELFANSASLKRDAEQVDGGRVFHQNYNFQGPVGAVQTGETVSANITQKFDDGAVESLRSALEILREQITDREDANEIIDVVQQELAGKEPDKGKVGGLLTALGSVVGTIGNLDEAYQNVKAIALAAGIPLP